MTVREFRWLEHIDSPRSLAWVQERNSHSLARLEKDPRYEPFRHAAIENYTAQDRIPTPTPMGGLIHNFWQDREHVKGIWRTTGLESYVTESPAWKTLLDIDALAEEEDEDWVYKGRTCLGPDFTRCLVHLSRGGSDAVEIREFDITTENFVNDGFFVTEAKTRVDWLDYDHLLIATDFGRGSLTTSGYPRTIRKWRRGTRLEDAELLFSVAETDMVAVPFVIYREEGTFAFVTRVPSFFTEETFFLAGPDKLQKVPFPEDADFKGVFDGKLIAEMRANWDVQGNRFAAGTLVAIDMQASLEAGAPVDPENVLVPDASTAIKSTSIGRDAIYVSLMEDVDGVFLELRPGADDDWLQKQVDLPDKGSIEMVANDAINDIVMLNYESFLVPSTLYLMDQGAEPQAIKSMPDRIDSDRFMSRQYFATSADGTRVPYYVVAAKDLDFDGQAPTCLSAYGGFEISMTPAYVTAMGIEWLKAGGVFVVANIRGGGEYGPDWHRAALLENRQRAYDDFIAVAEDLVARRITSPLKLGIRGGSNGGLLVTAVMVQRPDLFSAVICAVPLIDMLRYHKLSAGASWMAEYGDPDIPEQAEYIAKYSPYQNVREDAAYPEVFFWTNMKDDRVHPSHARRMVANMLSQGHPVLYYENTEGGHGGGADPLALAHTTALELVYLMQKLMDPVT